VETSRGRPGQIEIHTVRDTSGEYLELVKSCYSPMKTAMVTRSRGSASKVRTKANEKAPTMRTRSRGSASAEETIDLTQTSEKQPAKKTKETRTKIGTKAGETGRTSNLQKSKEPSPKRKTAAKKTAAAKQTKATNDQQNSRKNPTKETKETRSRQEIVSILFP
jgi:hypothetical protein